MFWFRLIDFFKTRLGHITLFCIATIILFIWSASYFKKRDDSQSLIASDFPRLSSSFGGPGHSTSSSEDNPAVETFEHDQVNASFSPFRPQIADTPKSRDPAIAKVETDTDQLEEPIVFTPLAPLIKFQSASTPDTQPEISAHIIPAEIPSLNLNPGAILYANLTAPISSEFPQGTVNAQLTRPLIRDGKTIASKGTKLRGKIKNASQSRLFFEAEWQLQLPDQSWITLQAEAQETSVDPSTGRFTLNDGQAGLPGLATPKTKGQSQLWQKTLRTLAALSGRLAQDRVRTAVGDHVPGTLRNAALEGATEIIEDYSPIGSAANTRVIIEAGRSFYLSITHSAR